MSFNLDNDSVCKQGKNWADYDPNDNAYDIPDSVSDQETMSDTILPQDSGLKGFPYLTRYEYSSLLGTRANQLIRTRRDESKEPPVSRARREIWHDEMPLKVSRNDV